MYIGGNFENAGGNEEVDNFAKLIDGEWIGTGIFNENVRALFSTGINLYMGGEFQDLNGIDEIDGITRYGCTKSTTTTNLLEHKIENSKPKIYPNPTTSMIRFDIEIDHILIYNAIGQILIDEFDSEEINMGDLMPGIYFVECTVNKEICIQKVIKN